MKKICSMIDCGSRATYGLTFGNPDRCKIHRENRKHSTMVCRCGSAYASFGNQDDERASYCVQCKTPEMVNIKDKKCQQEGCSRLQPRYNFSDQKGGRFCIEHRQEGMIDVKGKKCEEDGCLVSPHYNFLGEKKPRFCQKHKKEDMVDVKNLTCEIKHCRIQPNYNYLGEIKGRFCHAHKLTDMIDVRHSTCEYENCRIRPSFNLQGTKIGRFCIEHKSEDMINVIDKTCERKDCHIQPVFNFKGFKQGRFCAKHRWKDMIDIRHATCEYDNCSIRPTFNSKTENVGRFCKEHRLEGMINVVEVCEHPNCYTFPIFNFTGEDNKKRGRFCFLHRLDGMVDVKNRKCSEKDCSIQPKYNFMITDRPLYCTRHKKDGMMNLVDPPCKNTEACCSSYGNTKYKGYCAWCFQHLFPTDPLTLQIRTKTKEMLVREFIDNHFDGFIHDVPLYTPHCDCTIRRRIDHYRLIGNTILAIETDEHQHRGYDPEEEQMRYHDVYMGFSGKWIFIRFNPDGYKDHCGQRINPCLKDRLPTLFKMIETHIERIQREENTDMVEIHKMFYDECA